MLRPRLTLSALLVACTACAGALSPPQTSPTQSRTWTELRIFWDYGPCPADGRTCHQSLTVTPNGGFIASEMPDAAPTGAAAEASRRFAALDPQEIRELHRIVDAPGFVEKLGSFGCPPEHDATVRIELEGPWGVRQEEIGGCVHSSDTSPDGPRALVEILARHRWATRDAPPTRTLPPTGEGDPCTTSVGCGPGLVCAVSPCVVAPCESGACQKSRP